MSNKSYWELDSWNSLSYFFIKYGLRPHVGMTLLRAHMSPEPLLNALNRIRQETSYSVIPEEDRKILDEIACYLDGHEPDGTVH